MALLSETGNDQVDGVNFQGRHYIVDRRREYHGRSCTTPTIAAARGHVRFQCGMLHYIVTRRAARILAYRTWDGLPWDVAAFNVPGVNFVIAEPTPCIHDRSQGSIIEQRQKV